MTTEQQQAGGALVKREEFGGTQVALANETASVAVAARAKAEVEARHIMALRNPRDVDNVRVRLMKECKRPGFADVARYNKPVGKGVTGPSIRFVEAALRCLGNVDVDTMTVYEDVEKRIVRVTVADLESNLTFKGDVTIEKVVERRKLREGQKPIAQRTNSTGQTVYLVEATEDEMLAKTGALVSKAVRTLGLRLIPGDLVDEAMAIVVKVQNDKDAADPDAARKQLADAFASIGITPSQVKDYLGHGLEGCQPIELSNLRALYLALRDGETSWQEVLEQAGKTPEAQAKAADANQASALKEQIKSKLAGKDAPPTK